MIKETLIAINLFANISLSSLGGVVPSTSATVVQQENVLAQRELDLTNRIPNYTSGNQIFADNILLNLHYLKGDVEMLKQVQHDNGKDQAISGPQNIDWEKVRKPFEFTFILKPNEIFAYHENVLPEYKGLVALTTNSHFNYADGYKALNGLYGNGVCHLASVINWVAKDAGLESISFVNHNFAPIPDVPKEYGASIYYSPDGGRNTERQNLYIRNNFEVPVKFEFKADEKKVVLEISK